MTVRVRIGTLLFLLLWAVCLFSEEKPWLELRSPHFRLITNGQESDARHVLRRFELMRAVFENQFPRLKLDAPAPLLIIAAKDEATTKRLLPFFSAHSVPLPGGLYKHGWEREYALVRLDLVQSDPEAYHTIYHEYIHSLLHINFRWLPAWLDEGLAEFYGYTAFEGDKMLVGAPPGHGPVRVLYGMTLIPFKDFLTSQIYTSDVWNTQQSYMQSWGLTHFLMLSPEMDNGQRLSKFIGLVQQSVEQKKAFQETIGSFDVVQPQYEKYVHKLFFPARELPAPQMLNEKEFSARTLEPGETEAELAAWFIRFHDWDPMRQLTAASVQKGPKLSLAHEDNAFLLYNEGHDADALREFSTSVELSPKNYVALFAKIMLARTQDQQAFYAQLNQVIDLKPDFAPAYIELAKVNIANGDLRLALALTRKAEQIEPFRAGYHVLSGKILLQMDRPSEAAEEAAYVAKRWGGPDRDEAMELWDRIPALYRHDEPPATPEPGPQIRTAEGIVTAVTCNGRAFAITLEIKGQVETFKTEGFPVGYSDTLWVGEDHFTPCFHVQGLRAVLRYKSPKNDSYSGDLTSVGFREDVPVQTSAGVQAVAR